MPQDTVSVLVASWCPAFAYGMSAFLDEAPITPRIVHTIDSTLRMAGQETPDMVVVDDRLVDGLGSDLVQELRRHHPDVRVMLIVDEYDRNAQLAALQIGACGCIARSWDRAMVCEAVADALRGVNRFDLDVVRSLASMARSGEEPGASLTDQERVVLRLMRQHLTYKEIAQQMGISWHTVRSHAQSVLRKSGVHSRRDLQVGSGGIARGVTR